MAISSTITSSNGHCSQTASLRVRERAQVLLAGLHGVADLGEQVEGVGHGGGVAGEQGPAAGGFRATLEIDHRDPDESGGDHRPDRAQRRPQQRALPGAGGSGDEHVLAQQAEPERVAVLVVPDIQRRQVDLARIAGDVRVRDDVPERHLPLHHDREHGGADLGDRDPVGEQRGGQGVGLLGPGVQVLAAGHPHVQGVDRPGAGPDPQHAGHHELPGAPVVAHQVAVHQHGGPAAAAVDRPAAPVAAQPGRGPAVERGRVQPRPHHQHHTIAPSTVHSTGSGPPHAAQRSTSGRGRAGSRGGGTARPAPATRRRWRGGCAGPSRRGVFIVEYMSVLLSSGWVIC